MIKIPVDFQNRLKSLFDTIQNTYDKAASLYGFTCEGCTENCCTQRFHHHTLLEYLYLHEGLKSASPDVVDGIVRRAKIVTDTYQKELQIGEILPLMCPVNKEGLCLLYQHRPMICRYHGMPHRFTRPDGTSSEGGGCARFNSSHTASSLLDRTWAYMELAYLEKDLRLETGFRQRIKMTTAEMIMDIAGQDPILPGLMDTDY